MLNKRWSVCAAAALLYGGTAAAQQPGTLLVGGFGQYTLFDNGDNTLADLKDSFGGGGRLGVFIAKNWSLDAELSYTQADVDVAGAPKVKYAPLAARLTYGLPIFNRTQLLIGAGGVLTPFHTGKTNVGYTYGYGVSGDLGLRFGLTPMVNLRADAIADYNFTDPTFTNFRFQAGVEFMPDIASMTGMGATAQAIDWFGDQPQPQPGTLEIKGFGSYNYYDKKFDFDRGFSNSIGYGGGLGVFLTPRWELEGDGSYVNPTNTSGTTDVDYDNGNFAVRLNYNIPVFSRSQFIVGAGAVRSSFHRSDNALPDPLNTYEYGASGLVGFRFGFANRLALRVDGVADYLFGDLKALNLSGRAGLSYMIGGASRAAVDTTPAPPPPPAPDTTPAPPPPPPPPAPDTTPAPPPPPPPAPTVDTTAVVAPIYFDFDKSNIRDDAKATLDAKLPVLKANTGMRIRIEGNTDERGSDEYNIALGQRRAAAARKYLVDNGIDASRIDIVSYGEEKPVCTDKNEDCYQRNRRDDFRIVVMGTP